MTSPWTQRLVNEHRAAQSPATAWALGDLIPADRPLIVLSADPSPDWTREQYDAVEDAYHATSAPRRVLTAHYREIDDGVTLRTIVTYS